MVIKESYNLRVISGNMNFQKGIEYIARIQKVSYLKKLQKGRLRMTVLSHYHDEEKEHGKGRGDGNEGLIARCDNGTLYFAEKPIAEMKGITAYACLNNPILSFMRIDPLVTQRGIYFNIDDRVRRDFEKEEDADYGILIINGNEFVKRCEELFSSLNLVWDLHEITYSSVPLTDIESIVYNTVFRKAPEFSYQREIRLWTSKEITSESFYPFEIGDLSDISMLYQLPKRTGEEGKKE